MQVSIKNIVLIVFFAGFALCSFGQKILFYNSDKGLPSSLIHKISQDKNGYIWLATESGAGSFDGTRFTLYRHEQNKPGTIADNIVKIIFTDSKGCTWVGSASGLQIFDHQNNIFTDVPLQFDLLSAKPYVTSIVETNDNEKVLVSISGFGILIYNTNNHIIDSATTNWINNVFKNKYLGVMYFDASNNLWLHSEQGFFCKLNYNTKEIEPIFWDNQLYDLSGQVKVSAIAQDPVNHNIYIGTFNHGVFIYDNKTKKVRKPKGLNNPNYRVSSLLAAKTGNTPNSVIWVGTDDAGLKIFNNVTESIINPDFQYAPIDIENCKVHSLIQDVQGNIWAGIFQKGLLLIPGNVNNFEYIKLTTSKAAMSSNIACVTSIVKDIDNNTWIGTDGGGLFKVLPNGQKMQFTVNNSPLHNNAVLSLTYDKNQTLWISTYMGGITTYSTKNGFKKFNNSKLLQKVNCSVYDTVNNIIYFGTLGNGVIELAVNNNTFRQLPNNPPAGWISSLCIDNNFNLWIGHTRQLVCYNTVDQKYIFNNVTDKLNNIAINDLLPLPDGSVWIGTSNGLYFFNRPDTSLNSYTKNNGLPANVICAIELDSYNNMWVSTSNGLSKFNKNKNTFQNFYSYDGLQDNEFRVRSSFIDNTGKLYFGGINGISTFYPDKIIYEQKLESKINFTNLTVLNRQVSYNALLGKKNIIDRHISQANQITLKHKQNVFSIGFTVLEYTNPQKVVFQYMLKGFDKDWAITNINNSVATYTNLPEGHYQFVVKAFFEGSVDKNSAVYNSINIHILPPWYKTWWAYFVYLVLLCIMAYAFYNYLKQRKQRVTEQYELEKKETKLRMFTNLTHEIRTPFTLVFSPLKTLREAEPDPKRKELFNLMYRNSLRILRLLNQLMDMRKIDNNQLKLLFKKTDLISFINDIMLSFNQLAMMRNIDFRLVTNLSTLDIFIDRDNFDKVIYNILSNAFKYTPDNGNIMIIINVKTNNQVLTLRQNIADYVEIIVENSGSQINNIDTERVFERFYQSNNNIQGSSSGVGLHIAKMVVQLHFGNINAKNTTNGVAFTLQIPLGSEHLSENELVKDNQKQTGTLNAVQQNTAPKEPDFIELPNYGAFDGSGTPFHKPRYNIIFIDDDTDLCKYIDMELSEIYNVETFTNALDAWKTISTTLPDVVITDLNMENFDGKWLTNKIKQNPGTNHIPVIILTAEPDDESKQLLTETGADHYLIKPVSMGLFKSAIKQVIVTRETMRNKFRSDIKPDFDNAKISSPDTRLISNVISTIRKNIENPDFSVDDLSREVGLSRVHLNRKLKENINISPSNLIRSIRLKQAAYLLINNKVNIADVAYNVGFSSPSYFSNNFKDYFGMAPTEFVLKYIDSDDKESLNKLFNN